MLKDAYPGLYQLYYNVKQHMYFMNEVAYNNFIETPFNAIFGTGVKSSVYYISQINHPMPITIVSSSKLWEHLESSV